MKPYYSDALVTLYHGDCHDVLPLLPRAAVDMLCTDPPYAAAAATATTGFAREKWGGNWGDMSLVRLLADRVLSCGALAPEHEAYWFCDPYSFAASLPVFFIRYALTQSITWDKDMLGVGACYRKQTEFVLYARTAGAPAMAKDRRDLVRLRPNYSEKQHPCEKPVELMRYLLEATPWALCLDPFTGAGTTLVAAAQMGRRAIGIEIDERYCEVAARRLTGEAKQGGLFPTEAA